MAIKEKYKQAGRMEEGEHRVKVIDLKSGLSKKGDKMLTVTFESDAGHTIKAYFVKKEPFMMSQLDDLKEAAGLTQKEAADELLGLKVGILVKEQESEGDKIFMRIAGYGKVDDVESHEVSNGKVEKPAAEKKPLAPPSKNQPLSDDIAF